MAFNFERWLDTMPTDCGEGDIDETSTHFQRQLLSAAAWRGDKRLVVVELLQRGYNHNGYRG